jgi:hypothetical protein
MNYPILAPDGARHPRRRLSRREFIALGALLGAASVVTPLFGSPRASAHTGTATHGGWPDAFTHYVMTSSMPCRGGWSNGPLRWKANLGTLSSGGYHLRS